MLRMTHWTGMMTNRTGRTLEARASLSGTAPRDAQKKERNHAKKVVTPPKKTWRTGKEPPYAGARLREME